MTIAVTSAGRADGSRWDAYIHAHADATADHLWGWRSVFEAALGHDTDYLIAERDGQVVGVLPLVLFRSVLFGRSVISLPCLNYGGVLASDDAARDALLNAAADMAQRVKATHVELRQIARTTPSLPVRQHKVRVVLQLPSSVEALWTTVDRKIRNQVRKAQKEGLVVDHGREDLVPAFYSVFAENMRDLGTPVYPALLFEKTLQAFPDRTAVTVVRYRGRPVAAGFTIRFRDTVLNPWASSLRAYRSLCPNMLLYWSMLEAAIAQGSAAFDFGRSSPGGGTYDFKLQWGAAPEALHWEYVLLTRKEPPDQGPSNPNVTRFVAAWKHLPLRVANLVGPALSHHLP